MKKARKIVALVLVLFAILPVAVRAQSAQFVDAKVDAKGRKTSVHPFENVQAVKDFIARGFSNHVADVSAFKLASDDVVVVSFYTGSGLVRKRALVLRKEQFTNKLEPVMSISFQDFSTKLWDFPFFSELEEHYLKFRHS